MARNSVGGALAGLDDKLRERVRLLVSELVTNSVRHARLPPDERIRVDFRAGPTAVRVEVEDHGPGIDLNAPRRADGGWGLHLVELMASRWGVEQKDATRVWFEIDCNLPLG